MSQKKPSYAELEKRLAVAEPIVEALTHHQVDAVVGQEKISFLLLREVGEALQNSEAAFRAMFELSGVGMFQADTPGLRFTRVNQKFCEITGYSSDELLTRTYLGLVHPGNRKRAMNGLSRVFRGGLDAWVAEKRYVRKNGGVIWVGVNGVALRDDNGQVVKIMAMVSDITAHKLAEQKLRDRSAELRKLAAELARAEQRERRRIVQVLHHHIEEVLLGVKRRKAPLAPAHVRTVQQVLKDVQQFIDQSIAPPPPFSGDKHKPSARKGKALPVKMPSNRKARTEWRLA